MYCDATDEEDRTCRPENSIHDSAECSREARATFHAMSLEQATGVTSNACRIRLITFSWLLRRGRVALSGRRMYCRTSVVEAVFVFRCSHSGDCVTLHRQSPFVPELHPLQPLPRALLRHRMTKVGEVGGTLLDFSFGGD